MGTKERIASIKGSEPSSWLAAVRRIGQNNVANK